MATEPSAATIAAQGDACSRDVTRQPQLVSSSEPPAPVERVDPPVPACVSPAPPVAPPVPAGPFPAPPLVAPPPAPPVAPPPAPPVTLLSVPASPGPGPASLPASAGGMPVSVICRTTGTATDAGTAFGAASVMLPM